MRVVSLAEVKAKLSAYLQEIATTGPVVITRNGKAVAVLLAPIDDDDLERLLLARSPQFQSLLSDSRRSIRSGHGLTQAEFWTRASKPGKVASGVRETSSLADNARRPRATGRRGSARKR